MHVVSSNAALAARPLGHAVVLGGAGFIGAPLVQRLVDAGVRVTCLVHRRPAPARVGVLRGTLDTFHWQRLEADPPDVVFHLARIAGPGGWRRRVTRIRNRLANERLLSWLAACERPPLVVYVGGTLAYGSHGDALVTEETTIRPTSFARVYHEAEVPWLRAIRRGDAPVIVARPAWVLGAGSWFEAYFRRPMRESAAVPLYGDGSNWMSLVHVDDCAGLLAHAARRALPMSSVNVFSGPPVTQAELVERLAIVAGLPIRRVSLGEVEARYGATVREALSFSARIGSVHAALLATYTPRHTDLNRALAALL
jgi:nucleoside-diphosphate-sugar epimerase